MQCDTCGEIYYTDDQSKESIRKISDVRRRNERLLTGEDIQRIRRSLFLSQSELEDALGVGRKTVVRWELGTAVQSKALDNVLRLIWLDPDNLRLLVRLRDAALAPVVDQKLSPQDDRMTGELKQAVFEGLERAHADMSVADRVTESIVEVIREHRKERIERSATDMRAVV